MVVDIVDSFWWCNIAFDGIISDGVSIGFDGIISDAVWIGFDGDILDAVWIAFDGIISDAVWIAFDGDILDAVWIAFDGTISALLHHLQITTNIILWFFFEKTNYVHWSQIRFNSFLNIYKFNFLSSFIHFI